MTALRDSSRRPRRRRSVVAALALTALAPLTAVAPAPSSASSASSASFAPVPRSQQSDDPDLPYALDGTLPAYRRSPAVDPRAPDGVRDIPAYAFAR